MARKPPGAIRAARRAEGPAPQIPGLSMRTQSAIRRIEARGLGAGTVADALHTYHLFLRRPGKILYLPTRECPCCDPSEARDTLARALSGLPRDAAAELRRIVEELDERFLERTLPDPAAAGSADAWWRRRLRGE